MHGCSYVDILWSGYWTVEWSTSSCFGE